MSSKENFISQVCDAFKKAVERASGVTLEGREREFRRALTDHLFDKVLGWNGHSKVGEIYDIACFDDEDFPTIITETKWNVELTPEIKGKLRKRIEELGSVKYGVFASEREFLIYAYEDYELKEITKLNVAELVGVARKEFGLPDVGKRRVLKLEQLKRERLVWIEDPDYFERTYKEVSVAKREGVNLLIQNLKNVVKDLTAVLMNFFDSYYKREEYSGRFLKKQFNDWLKHSMKDEEFKKGDEEERGKIIEVFCRETAYVFVGRILFIRTCEDKEILKPLSLSGEGLAESLRYYEKRKRKNPYLLVFDESHEVIKKYYSHLHELGFFDWWWIEEVKKEILSYDDKRVQDSLEEDLNYSAKKSLRRLNRFDFTQVNRDILGDVYQGYLPPDERKRLGEFYTPKEVIEYILDAVGYKPENEIRSKKILDSACGSGSFLVEATQRLTERYRRIGFNLKDPEDAKQIIEGCINSIYGLDIHPFACFIAEMNLLFQLVDLYDVVRQKYKYYELPRLNIYRTDSLMPPSEHIELTEFLDNSRRKMLIEETKGANRIKNIKFDYFVGNPPYVRIVRWYDPSLAKYYRRIYESAFWNFDLYILFIERGLKWLKDGGKLGFICSNQFMIRRYGKKLRAYILKNSAIKQIIDFGDSGVFKDVTNYPCILILENKGSNGLLKCVRVISQKTNILEDIKSHIHLDSYDNVCYSIFPLDERKLSEETWSLAPVCEEKVLEKTEKNSNFVLDQSCQVISGMRIGKDALFIVYKMKEIDEELVEALPIAYVKERKSFIVEKKLLRPILKGRNVRKWEVKWQGLYVIFSHKKENSDVVVIPEGEMKEKYPNTYEYFTTHKDVLKERIWFGKTPIELHGTWYAIMYTDVPEIYETPKILTPALTNKNNFALDTRKNFFVGGTAGVIGILTKETDPLYLLGLLNSKLYEYYLKHKTPVKSGGYYQFSVDVLKQLPLKLPLTETEEEMAKEIAQNVTEILELHEKNDFINRKIERFPDSYLKNDWNLNKLMNVIKAQKLSKISYVMSEKRLRSLYLRDLNGKEIFRIILASNEFMDFYSEEVASYVLEVLKTQDRITKRELLELEIPPREHSKNLMYQYRKDKEQIAKNEKTVKDLEKQIDDLVYKLYDITYKERRIIEEYLAKF